ncbi:MAG: hypothetical protein ACKO6N_07850 [Myxococcota bacterium]
MTPLQEGELLLTFPPSWKVERFDSRGKILPAHICPVDFIAETPDKLLLIEIKDPSNSKAPPKERLEFIRKMQSQALTHQELVPKARTSWSYLHLMARTTKPLFFVVLVGAEALAIEPVLWLNLSDRLQQRLDQEAEEPWVTPYIDGCIVLPAIECKRHHVLEGMTVARVP